MPSIGVGTGIINHTTTAKRDILDEASIAFVAGLLAHLPKPYRYTRTGCLRPEDDTIADFLSLFLKGPAIAAISNACAYISQSSMSTPTPHNELGPLKSTQAVLVLELHMQNLGARTMSHSCNVTFPPNGRGMDLRRTRVLVRKDKVSTYNRELEESVSSLCLVLPLTKDAPYTIFALMDSFAGFFAGTTEEKGKGGITEVPSAFPSKEVWISNGFIPCGRGTGVTQFLCVVLSAFRTWESGWYSTLTMLDQAVRVTVMLHQSPAAWELDSNTKSSSTTPWMRRSGPHSCLTSHSNAQRCISLSLKH